MLTSIPVIQDGHKSSVSPKIGIKESVAGGDINKERMIEGIISLRIELD
jgi:hypothetical protein